MTIEKCFKESFVVIGKQGSTSDGADFVQRLWVQANAGFGEIQHMAKKNEQGNLCGIWGAMSDFSHSFQPWEENYSKGLYLAGAECEEDAIAPETWTRWVIPSYEYLYVECDGSNVFSQMIEYMKTNHISLAGAVHDFTCPETGKNYMFFPIRRM